MIGIWSEYAVYYLIVVAVATFLFFGLPMMLWPLKWARPFKWKIPEQTHLAIYFGRCLGGIICSMAVFAFISTKHIETMILFYQFILANFFIMIAVHAYGALKKIQPAAETYEILYWVLMVMLTLLFFPTGM